MMPSACPLSELDVPGAPLVKSCAYQPPDEAEKLVTKSARMRETSAHARLARKRCSFNTAAELKNSSAATHKSKNVIKRRWPKRTQPGEALARWHYARKQCGNNCTCCRAATHGKRTGGAAVGLYRPWPGVA